MAEGRLARFAGGLGLGYLHTLAVLVVGLWLTPFLLRQLGSHDYGLWLLASQVLVYLALMDFGVVALVPREVAFAVGQRAAARGTEVRPADPVGRRRPPHDRPGGVADAGRRGRGGRGGVAVARRMGAAAAPVRDRGRRVRAWRFRCACSPRSCRGCRTWRSSAAVQLAAWIAGHGHDRRAGVRRGRALRARGRMGGVAAAAGVRGLAPRRHALSRCACRAASRGCRGSEARQQLGRGTWISVGQIAQVLLSGTDLVVVGKLLGPEAIVPYACTGKLMALLANQPQLFMQMALPALSELRGSAARDRLFDVSRSMTQLMLLASGAIVAVVLVVNAPSSPGGWASRASAARR